MLPQVGVWAIAGLSAVARTRLRAEAEARLQTPYEMIFSLKYNQKHRASWIWELIRSKHRHSRPPRQKMLSLSRRSPSTFGTASLLCLLCSISSVKQDHRWHAEEAVKQLYDILKSFMIIGAWHLWQHFHGWCEEIWCRGCLGKFFSLCPWRVTGWRVTIVGQSASGGTG